MKHRAPIPIESRLEGCE
jgi:hypothetical protein